jgi:hypothetical protein
MTRRHYLAQQTFPDVGHLDSAIHTAARDLNHERNQPRCAVMSRAAWRQVGIDPPAHGAGHHPT